MTSDHVTQARNLIAKYCARSRSSATYTAAGLTPDTVRRIIELAGDEDQAAVEIPRLIATAEGERRDAVDQGIREEFAAAQQTPPPPAAADQAADEPDDDEDADQDDDEDQGDDEGADE